MIFHSKTTVKQLAISLL